MLVMEYIPEGNLMQVHLRKIFSSEEMRTVLRQTLRALAYLQRREENHPPQYQASKHSGAVQNS